MPELSDDVEMLIDGARYGDSEDVTAALDAKVPVNAADEQGRTGLHMACANGHTDIVRLLLDSGADVLQANAEGNTPLHWACLNGHTEVVRLLMNAGASPSALNSHERTPVDEALDSMCRDDLLGIIDAYMQQGGSDAKQGSDFDGSSAGEDGPAFPTKPRSGS